MTDVAFPPGWRPDPHDPASLRWWNGAEWSEHRSPASPLRDAGHERAVRRSDPFTSARVVLRMLRFLIELYAIPALLGVVSSSIALARGTTLDSNGVRSSGKVAASIGIALGVAATLVFAVRLAALLAG